MNFLSFTQINMLMRCPRQYDFRYNLKMIIPPKAAQTLGTTVHQTEAYGYKRKLADGRGYSTYDLMDLFSEYWNLNLSSYEPIFEEDETPGKLKDQGVNLVKHYGTKVGRYVYPKMVEQKFTIPADEERPDVIGYIDLATVKEDLIDIKVSSKTPTQDSVDQDMQLTAYDLGYDELMGNFPRSLKLHVILRTKEPRVAIIETKRTSNDHRIFLETVSEMSKFVSSGVFPRNTNGWWCSEKWCGYYGRCMKK